MPDKGAQELLLALPFQSGQCHDFAAAKRQRKGLRSGLQLEVLYVQHSLSDGSAAAWKQLRQFTADHHRNQRIRGHFR